MLNGQETHIEEDEQLLEPGPFAEGDGESGEEGETPEGETPAETNAKPQASAAKPLFQGLMKEIQSPEELAQYARELERKQIELEARMSERRENEESETPAATKIEKKDLAEMLFTDPERVLTELKQEIREEIYGSQKKQQDEQMFWNEFYNEYSDLRSNEDIVGLVLNKNMTKWRDIPLAQGKKLLANEVRARLNAIRGVAGD